MGQLLRDHDVGRRPPNGHGVHRGQLELEVPASRELVQRPCKYQSGRCESPWHLVIRGVKSAPTLRSDTFVQDKKTVAANIETQARHARALVIWTDCDLEGEHIGSEIRDAARRANAQIQVKRARFSNVERA